MTDIGELVAVSNIADDKEKCPFCPGKNLDDCKAKKSEPVNKVVSKPSQLNCTRLKPKGDFSYTTAKHHLISAKQCYAKLRRCVRMGSMAGYDINDPPNGIALPTVANNLRYTIGGAVKKKYGKLSPDEKKQVSFAVMRTEKAQWHVGHHAVTVELCENWADEEEDTPWRRGHQVSYDNEVVAQLLKILSTYNTPAPCDDTKPDKFKSDMDNLSAKIKNKLNKFGVGKPAESSPYFVSRLAYDFAVEGSEEDEEKSW
ncbi:MAG: AHH domain-containing protein [Gammaproteobacteria bacterium]|nr:AHH domain-containing protein [Gammaproteobacteria bacterium]MCF6260157.1 AHH domain-containing protein [Gammaproteobacteria bacterium]